MCNTRANTAVGTVKSRSSTAGRSQDRFSTGNSSTARDPRTAAMKGTAETFFPERRARTPPTRFPATTRVAKQAKTVPTIQRIRLTARAPCRRMAILLVSRQGAQHQGAREWVEERL
jgi:hypothetical protein